MKINSYYGVDCTSYFRYWTSHIGEAFPKTLAKELNAEVELIPITQSNYNIKDDADISYCQLYYIPKTRPNGLIFTWFSDYYPDQLKNWIVKVKPNVILSLQSLPEDLIDFANNHKCLVELCPWFSLDNTDYICNKTINGMITGNINSNYPSRSAIYSYLLNKNFNNVILSCGQQFGKYQLTTEEFNKKIKQTKYYFSGCIFDNFVPPKYIEVMSVGATLVSFETPYMRKLGFKDGENYIKLNQLEDIDSILKSDNYKEIGLNAYNFIKQNHSIKNRIKQFIGVLNEGNGL